ncbi:MAG TPA: P-II family nitrogen regulator [Candidatus Dormibacteraeota bacterium]|jgi:nitrogen regulatory protein P-II 2
MMKMVIAIIRHEHLQDVQDVLDECGVSGVTVTEVKGCGAQRGYTERYRGTAVNISLRPRLKIEAVMRAEIVDRVVEMMAGAARTGAEGEVGDGKIFVINVEEAIRIRTGERGPETVQHAERAMWGH